MTASRLKSLHWEITPLITEGENYTDVLSIVSEKPLIARFDEVEVYVSGHKKEVSKLREFNPQRFN